MPGASLATVRLHPCANVARKHRQSQGKCDGERNEYAYRDALLIFQTVSAEWN